MHEAHSPALDRGDLRVDGGAEAPASAGVEGVEEGERRVGNRRYGKKRSASLGREDGHAIGYEVFQRSRDGKRLAGRDRPSFPLERTPELQGEERVSTRGSVHADERGTGKREGEPLVQKTVERAEAQRPQAKLLEALGGERSLHRERRRSGLPCPPGEQDADRKVLQAPDREAENARRRRIEPLNVVDGEDEGAARRQQAKSAREREPDGALVWRERDHLLEEERDLERAPLRPGEPGEHLPQTRVEQVGERSERELRLDLHRPGAKYAVVQSLGLGDSAKPDRRFSDTRFPLEDKRRRTATEGVEE